MKSRRSPTAGDGRLKSDTVWVQIPPPRPLFIALALACFVGCATTKVAPTVPPFPPVLPAAKFRSALAAAVSPGAITNLVYNGSASFRFTVTGGGTNMALINTVRWPLVPPGIVYFYVSHGLPVFLSAGAGLNTVTSDVEFQDYSAGEYPVTFYRLSVDLLTTDPVQRSNLYLKWSLMQKNVPNQ